MSAQPQSLSAEQLVEFSFQRHISDILYAVIYRIIRRRDLVEEVLQDVRVLCLSQTKKDLIMPLAWLVTVARNRAFDVARHTSISREELVSTVDGEDVECDDFSLDNIDPARIAEAGDELSLLLGAIRQLPARQREVFTLKKVYGYSQQEIAQRMGISENTIEQHMVRALRTVSGILNDGRALDE